VRIIVSGKFGNLLKVSVEKMDARTKTLYRRRDIALDEPFLKESAVDVTEDVVFGATCGITLRRNLRFARCVGDAETSPLQRYSKAAIRTVLGLIIAPPTYRTTPERGLEAAA
jgi:hypothetical protein